MNINDLTTQDGFSAFLQAYHQRLHDERSFPPLGTQKALHTASPIFGYKNWQAMSQSSSWNLSQTQNQSDEAIAILIESRQDYTPFSEEHGVVEQTYFKLFRNESDACAYLHHLIALDNEKHKRNNLFDKNGPIAELASVQTSDYEFSKWVECASRHLSATIQVKRLSNPDPRPNVTPLGKTDASWQSKICEFSFTVEYLGQPQSPHESQYSIKGCREELRSFMADLITEDLGAITNIVHQMNDAVMDPHHDLHKSSLFCYLKGSAQRHTEDDIKTAIRRAATHSDFGLKQFVELLEASAGVVVRNQKLKAASPSVDSDVSDVVNHVLEMQQEYGFSNDEDSVREAVEESASLLGIQLNEVEIIQACDRILGH